MGRHSPTTCSPLLSGSWTNYSPRSSPTCRNDSSHREPDETPQLANHLGTRARTTGIGASGHLVPGVPEHCIRDFGTSGTSRDGRRVTALALCVADVCGRRSSVPISQPVEVAANLARRREQHAAPGRSLRSGPTDAWRSSRLFPLLDPADDLRNPRRPWPARRENRSRDLSAVQPESRDEPLTNSRVMAKLRACRTIDAAAHREEA